MSSSLVDSLPGPVGFVFGGGGSLGAMQVGMLQAVSEHGVHAGIVTGTSIGAINGAIVAVDPIGAPHPLSHVWSEITTKLVLPGGLASRLKTWVTGKNHVFTTTAIDALFEREIGDELIENLAIPYAALALDVGSGLAAVLDRGPLASALRASSAIPGVFPPVERDGRHLYDGGMVVNLPVHEAVALGAKSLVVFDCSFSQDVIEPPTRVGDAIEYAMAIQLRQQAARDLPVIAGSVPVVHIPGPPPQRVSPLDFDHTNELIRSAYDTTRGFLSTIDIDGPGLYDAASAGTRPTSADDPKPVLAAV